MPERSGRDFRDLIEHIIEDGTWEWDDTGENMTGDAQYFLDHIDGKGARTSNDKAPDRIRVMEAVTIEKGVVTSITFGEPFQSDPDKAFGPYYISEKVFDDMLQENRMLRGCLEKARTDLSAVQRVDFERSISLTEIDNVLDTTE